MGHPHLPAPEQSGRRATQRGRAICVQIGRVLGRQLGVLGTDGAFGDDGRFHPLPLQPSNDECVRSPNFIQYLGPIPASAYNGRGSCTVPKTAHAGGRSSPIARPCSVSALRLLAYGIAPQGVAGVRLLGARHAQSEQFGSARDRVFLFVVAASDLTTGAPHRLRVVAEEHRQPGRAR